VTEPIEGRISAVCRSATHTMRKDPVDSIRLVEGLGVDGDAHQGETVKHRSRVAVDPTQPNLRQLHLVHAELHDELARSGFTVEPGRMGENITTRGIDLLALPVGTRLHLGEDAIAEVTGLRNPCGQLNGIARGLMDATLEKRPDGTLIRKAGVMAVIRRGGVVQVGDRIRVELPSPPHRALAPV
jgi:MOSC domain-containing protein YiiM